MKKKIGLFSLIALLLCTLLPTGVSAESLTERMSGRILLQVEQNGEAWYVNPTDNRRYYMGRPQDAFDLMRSLGVGISDENLAKIRIADFNLAEGIDSDGDGLGEAVEDSLETSDEYEDTDSDGQNDKEEILSGSDPNSDGLLGLSSSFAMSQAGRILLQVEQNGEAWYVNPTDNRRYYMGRPQDAFDLMRSLGVGISDENLDLIEEYIEVLAEEGSDSIDFSEEWEIYMKYLIAFQERNLDTMNLYSHDSVDLSELTEEGFSLDDLWAFLEIFMGVSKTDKSEFSLVDKDEKQTIIWTPESTTEEDDSFLREYIYFVRNSNDEIKILLILTSSVSDEAWFYDYDKDGLPDVDEFCGGIYNEFDSECTETNKEMQDSDGDGWWDGIEEQAETDPNDPEDYIVF